MDSSTPHKSILKPSSRAQVTPAPIVTNFKDEKLAQNATKQTSYQYPTLGNESNIEMESILKHNTAANARENKANVPSYTGSLSSSPTRIQQPAATRGSLPLTIQPRKQTVQIQPSQEDQRHTPLSQSRGQARSQTHKPLTTTHPAAGRGGGNSKQNTQVVSRRVGITLDKERRVSQRLDEKLILGLNRGQNVHLSRHRRADKLPRGAYGKAPNFMKDAFDKEILAKDTGNSAPIVDYGITEESDHDSDTWIEDEGYVDQSLLREYEIAAEAQERKARIAYERMYIPELKTDLQTFHENFEHVKQLFFYRPFEIIVKCKMFVSDSCYKIVKSNNFENLILLTIIFNSGMLMLDDPTSDDSTPFQAFTEEFFLWAYTAESVLKIFAHGFIKPKNAYLKDGWNMLDFIIVFTSLLPLIIGSATINLKALRSLRILRPLRTISKIKKLKILLKTLFSAIPYLLNTLIILVFFFLIFAIGGLQLFGGLLLRRCFEVTTGIITPGDDTCGGEKGCDEGYQCGKGMDNPAFTVTSFDNIFYAFLMVFQIITMEGWTQIMFAVFDSFTIFAALYFILLIFIGSFFLLNLTLAVIKAKFSDNQLGSGDSMSKDGDNSIVNEEEQEAAAAGENVQNSEMRLDIVKAFRRMQRELRVRASPQKELPFETNERGFVWDQLVRLRALQKLIKKENSEQQDILRKQLLVQAWRKKQTEKIKAATKRIFKSYKVRGGQSTKQFDELNNDKVAEPILPVQRIFVYPTATSKPITFMGLQSNQQAAIIAAPNSKANKNESDEIAAATAAAAAAEAEAEKQSDDEFWQELALAAAENQDDEGVDAANQELKTLASFGYKSNLQLTKNPSASSIQPSSLSRQSTSCFSLANLKKKYQQMKPPLSGQGSIISSKQQQQQQGDLFFKQKKNVRESSASPDSKKLKLNEEEKLSLGNVQLTPRLNSNVSTLQQNCLITEDALIDQIDDNRAGNDSMLSSMSVFTNKLTPIDTTSIAVVGISTADNNVGTLVNSAHQKRNSRNANPKGKETQIDVRKKKQKQNQSSNQFDNSQSSSQQSLIDSKMMSESQFRSESPLKRDHGAEYVSSRKNSVELADIEDAAVRAGNKANFDRESFVSNDSVNFFQDPDFFTFSHSDSLKSTKKQFIIDDENAAEAKAAGVNELNDAQLAAYLSEAIHELKQSSMQERETRLLQSTQIDAAAAASGTPESNLIREDGNFIHILSKSLKFNNAPGTNAISPQSTSAPASFDGQNSPIKPYAKPDGSTHNNHNNNHHHHHHHSHHHHNNNSQRRSYSNESGKAKHSGLAKMKSQTSDIGVIHENEDEEQQDEFKMESTKFLGGQIGTSDAIPRSDDGHERMANPNSNHHDGTSLSLGDNNNTSKTEAVEMQKLNFYREKKLMEAQWLNERIAELQEKFNSMNTRHSERDVLETQAMLIEREQRLADEKEKRESEERMIRTVNSWTIALSYTSLKSSSSSKKKHSYKNDAISNSARDVILDKHVEERKAAELAAELQAFRDKRYLVFYKQRQVQVVKKKTGKRSQRSKKLDKQARQNAKIARAQKLAADRAKRVKELQMKYVQMKEKAAMEAAAAAAAAATATAGNAITTSQMLIPPNQKDDNKSIINFATHHNNHNISTNNLQQQQQQPNATAAAASYFQSLAAPSNNNNNNNNESALLRSFQANGIANNTGFSVVNGQEGPSLSISSLSKTMKSEMGGNASSAVFSGDFGTGYIKIPTRLNKWITMIESNNNDSAPQKSLTGSQLIQSHLSTTKDVNNNNATHAAFSRSNSSRFLNASTSFAPHKQAGSTLLSAMKKVKIVNLKEAKKQLNLLSESPLNLNDYGSVVETIHEPIHDVEPDSPTSNSHNDLRLLQLREDFSTGIKQKNVFSGVEVKAGVIKGGVGHLNRTLLPLSSVRQTTMMWLPGIIGFLKILHFKIYSFAVSDLFGNIATLAVFGNTFILALDGTYTEESTLNLLDSFNSIFSYIFIVEMAIKVIGLTPAGYIRDRMNIFDGLIVSLSIFELLFMSGGSKAVSAFRAVRIFRTFRVLRVTRLLRGLQFMGKIVKVINKTMDSFVYIALLLFLFIFIFSLLGMQMYGGDFPILDARVRQNFDSFQNAFISIFQVMTMENWNDILYKAFHSSVSRFLSSFFLIVWIFIGNWIFLNLFLAILLDGFTDTAGDDDDENNLDEDLLEGQIVDGHQFDSLKAADERVNNAISAVVDLPLNQANLKKLNQDEAGGGGGAFDRMDTEEMEELEQEILKLEGKNASRSTNFLEVDFTGVDCEISLYAFSKENLFRRFCYACIKHPKFESIILFFIVTSSLKLVVDTYIEDGSDLDKQLKNVDFAFNGIFIIEATLKIISLGFFQSDNSYLSESWSQIDFFIVCTSIVDMSFDGIDISFLKILRLLRTLRPLRFISHNANMKVVVIALFESVTGIINVLIVIMLIWLMFAILGISLIGQRMGYCGGLTSVYEINYDACIEMGHEWKRYDTNYDNILNAMRTLYVISSLEGWPDLMYQAIDSNTTDNGPVKDNYIIISNFYILFILVGSFFLVNLFVGVIFLNFNEAQKNESQSSLFLTEDQKRWIEFQQMIIGVKAEFSQNPVPKQPVRRMVFNLIHTNKFEIFIMTLIVINIITMGMTFEGSTTSYDSLLENVNLVFTVFFVLELTLKFIALGLSTFWRSGWNKFDFFVVASSLFDIMLTQIGAFSASFLRIGPQLIRIVRVFRVSRLLKLVKSMKGLQKLIETLLFSLPSLINVGALLFLVFFIYSVLGVFLFKDVKTGDVINEYNNFSNFGFAMLTLFRCSTGENWYQFMFDCGKTTECTEGVNCGSQFSSIYFVTFILICSFIMLNLFILIIIQYFEDYHMKDDNPLQAFNDKLELFRLTWARYTKKTFGEKINSNDIVGFLYDLPEPLGYCDTTGTGDQSRQPTKKQIAKEVMSWGLPQQTENKQDYVFFNDMLYGCMRKEYGSKLLQNAGPEIQRMLNKLEVETRLKIAEKKKKMVLRKNKKLFMEMEARTQRDGTRAGGGSGKRANPMIAFMFLQMAFKAWHRYSDDPEAHDNSAISESINEEEEDYDQNNDVQQEGEGEEVQGGEHHHHNQNNSDSSESDDEIEQEKANNQYHPIAKNAHANNNPERYNSPFDAHHRKQSGQQREESLNRLRIKSAERRSIRDPSPFGMADSQQRKINHNNNSNNNNNNNTRMKSSPSDARPNHRHQSQSLFTSSDSGSESESPVRSEEDEKADENSSLSDSDESV